MNPQIQDDPRMVARAARLVIAHQIGSAAFLQRRMGIGFGPAAHLMNLLEENGVVGPHKPFRSREVLVTADQVDEVLASMGVGEAR